MMNRHAHLLLTLGFFLLTGSTSVAQLTFVTSELPQPTIETALPGEHLTITNVKYKGSDATFARVKAPAGTPLFTDALLLSTGRATDAAGPNDNCKTSSPLGLGGDYRLDDVSGTRTFDATLINIIFVPELDSVTISFIFASEEYNEGVNNTFNDLFLIEASGPGLGQGINLGALPGRGNGKIPIGVQTVNVQQNKDFYVDNNPYKLNGTRDAMLEQKLNPTLLKTFEFDGLTRVIHTGMRVKPGAEYNLRIAIGDAGDGQFDSALLLESFGFRGLEQHKHEVRRQMIAEQHRKDSIHTADSIAFVLQMRLDSIHTADSLAAVQREDSIRSAEAFLASLPAPPDPLAMEEKIMISYDSLAEMTSDATLLRLDQVAAKVIQHPELKIGLYAPDSAKNPLAARRLRLIMLYFIAAGVPEERIFENGFSFGFPRDSKERVEVWVREE